MVNGLGYFQRLSERLKPSDVDSNGLNTRSALRGSSFFGSITLGVVTAGFPLFEGFAFTSASAFFFSSAILAASFLLASSISRRMIACKLCCNFCLVLSRSLISF
jgi:hypothetical protein